MNLLSDCAHELIDVARLVMNAVRAAMRDLGPGDLSVTQFRALKFVDYHDGASLSDLADHLGFQLPSASRLVAWLVEQKLLTRQQRAGNRRCVSLAATERRPRHEPGRPAFAESYLRQRLSSLPEDEQAEVLRGLSVLHALLPAIVSPTSKTIARRSRWRKRMPASIQRVYDAGEVIMTRMEDIPN